MLGSSSRWIEIKSGVTQGSVLGPLLFLIYINDIDELVVSKILKFADDKKLYGVVANQPDKERLKNWRIYAIGLQIGSCCLMLINARFMHFGYSYSKRKYEMNGKDLEEISEKHDLGVIVQQDLKMEKNNV
jgi:ribonuclease P/MRP protein subunit RPP40